MNNRFDLRHRSLFIFLAVYISSIIFFPEWKIFFSSPLLASAVYRLKPNKLLWFALWTGVCLDLFSSDYPIGFHAAVFIATCLGLNALKHHFFSDSLSTLPIMTCFASLFRTVATALLSPFFDLTSRFSIPWVFTDLICMPVIDALVAFILFIGIPMTFQMRSRKRQEYFMKDSS